MTSVSRRQGRMSSIVCLFKFQFFMRWMRTTRSFFEEWRIIAHRSHQSIVYICNCLIKIHLLCNHVEKKDDPYHVLHIHNVTACFGFFLSRPTTTGTSAAAFITGSKMSNRRVFQSFIFASLPIYDSLLVWSGII